MLAKTAKTVAKMLKMMFPHLPSSPFPTAMSPNPLPSLGPPRPRPATRGRIICQASNRDITAPNPGQQVLSSTICLLTTQTPQVRKACELEAKEPLSPQYEELVQ